MINLLDPRMAQWFIPLPSGILAYAHTPKGHDGPTGVYLVRADTKPRVYSGFGAQAWVDACPAMLRTKQLSPLSYRANLYATKLGITPEHYIEICELCRGYKNILA